jgi:plastocyanin
MSTALLLGAAACGSEDPAEPTRESGSGDTQSVSGGATAEVSAADFSFTPEAVSVPAGAEVTVTFTNDGDAPHTMTSEDLKLDIAADPGESADGTFIAPDSGSVDFHCEIHPDMVGQIVVKGSDTGDSSDSGEGEDDSSDGSYDY